MDRVPRWYELFCMTMGPAFEQYQVALQRKGGSPLRSWNSRKPTKVFDMLVSDSGQFLETVNLPPPGLSVVRIHQLALKCTRSSVG